MHWTTERPGHTVRANVRQDVPTRTSRSERDGPGDDCCNAQHDARCVRAVETCRGANSLEWKNRRGSHLVHSAATAVANFGFKRGTRIIELLVSLCFRSSHESVLQVLAN